MDEVIIGDICDQTIINELAEKQFDVVIHLISLDHFKSESEPNIVSSINVMPTWNLLDRLTKNGLEKFIYFSTTQVYGDVPKTVIKENHIADPCNIYGLTHLLSENICNYFNKNTNTKCINVRLSNSYGSPVFNENNCWWLVINDLCKTAFTKNNIKLSSDGSPVRDFIHSSDIYNAINLIIEVTDDFNDNIFHIASGETLTILELAHIVKDVFADRYNKIIPINLSDDTVLADQDKFDSLERFTFDIKRLNNLGFKKKTNLEVGINGLFNYLEKNNAN